MQTLKKHPGLVLSLLAALLYSPTIFFEWVYLDDYLFVQEAEFYTNLNSIFTTFGRYLWLPQAGEYMYYRPVSTALYVISAWISDLSMGEVQAWPFHVTNVLLIGCMTAALYALLLDLKLNARAAFAATALFVAHPATVASVAWISGQNELLLALFVLLAFTALSKGRFSVFALWFLIALLTKENAAAVIPLSICFVMLKGRATLRQWSTLFAALLVPTLIWLLLVGKGAGQATPSAAKMMSALIAGIPNLSIFIGKLILPFDFSVLTTAKDTPNYVFITGAIAGIALTLYGVWSIRRRPLIIFGVIWFVAFLLPTFAKMDPVTSDQFILRGDRSLLASIGLLISISAWVLPIPHRVSVSAFTALALLNIWHQFEYQNGFRFYSNAALNSPNLAFAHTHLGDMYIQKGDFKAARNEYELALKLNPSEYNAHNNLGVVFQRTGDLEQALLHYKKEIEANPANILSHYNIGVIEFNRQNDQEAERSLRRVVELNSRHKEAWRALLYIYARRKNQEKFEEATKAIDKAESALNRGI